MPASKSTEPKVKRGMASRGSSPTQLSRMPATPSIVPLSTLPVDTAIIIERPKSASIQYSGALNVTVKFAIGVENKIRHSVEKTPPINE